MITCRTETQALAVPMAFPLGNEMSGSVAVPAFAFLGLLLHGMRVASSGARHRGDGREHRARGMVVVELGHFSTSGPVLVVGCGKVLRKWCHAQNKTETKLKLETTRGLRNTWGRSWARTAGSPLLHLPSGLHC